MGPASFSSITWTIFTSEVRCIDAPIPPNNTNLQHNYTAGAEIEFGDRIRYRCESGHTFNHDYYFSHFDIMCTNGSWLWNGTEIGEDDWYGCTKPSGEQGWRSRQFSWRIYSSILMYA